MRQRLEDSRLALPPDVPELTEELLAHRVRFRPDGKTQMESKDDVKSRIGRSPDYVDAVAISLYPEMETTTKRVRFV